MKWWWRRQKASGAGWHTRRPLRGLLFLLMPLTLLTTGCISRPAPGVQPEDPPAYEDHDLDGVADQLDRCPLTRAGVAVDRDGCVLDTDRDRIPDTLDRCPNSDPGAWVDSRGCDQDRDRDGVIDSEDQCRQTPPGTLTDARGCAVFSN